MNWRVKHIPANEAPSDLPTTYYGMTLQYNSSEKRMVEVFRNKPLPIVNRTPEIEAKCREWCCMGHCSDTIEAALKDMFYEGHKLEFLDSYFGGFSSVETKTPS